MARPFTFSSCFFVCLYLDWKKSFWQGAMEPASPCTLSPPCRPARHASIIVRWLLWTATGEQARLNTRSNLSLGITKFQKDFKRKFPAVFHEAKGSPFLSSFFFFFALFFFFACVPSVAGPTMSC